MKYLSLVGLSLLPFSGAFGLIQINTFDITTTTVTLNITGTLDAPVAAPTTNSNIIFIGVAGNSNWITGPLVDPTPGDDSTGAVQWNTDPLNRNGDGIEILSAVVSDNVVTGANTTDFIALSVLSFLPFNYSDANINNLDVDLTLHGNFDPTQLQGPALRDVVATWGTNTNPGDGDVIATAGAFIPEPSFAGLIIGIAALTCAARRRRKGIA